MGEGQGAGGYLSPGTGSGIFFGRIFVSSNYMLTLHLTEIKLLAPSGNSRLNSNTNQR